MLKRHNSGAIEVDESRNGVPRRRLSDRVREIPTLTQVVSPEAERKQYANAPSQFSSFSEHSTQSASSIRSAIEKRTTTSATVMDRSVSYGTFHESSPSSASEAAEYVRLSPGVAKPHSGFRSISAESPSQTEHYPRQAEMNARSAAPPPSEFGRRPAAAASAPQFPRANVPAAPRSINPNNLNNPNVPQNAHNSNNAHIAQNPNIPAAPRSINPTISQNAHVSNNAHNAQNPNIPAAPRSINPNVAGAPRSIHPNMPAAPQSINPNIPPAPRSMNPNVAGAPRSINPVSQINPINSNNQINQNHQSNPNHQNNQNHQNNNNPNIPAAPRSINPNIAGAVRSINQNIPAAPRSISPNVPPAPRSINPNIAGASRSMIANMPPPRNQMATNPAPVVANIAEDEAFMTPRIRQLMNNANDTYQKLHHPNEAETATGQRVQAMLNQQPNGSNIQPVIRHVNPSDQYDNDLTPHSELGNFARQKLFAPTDTVAVTPVRPSPVVDHASLNVVAAELTYTLSKQLTHDLPHIIERAFKKAISSLENDIREGLNISTQNAVREFLEERERTGKFR